MLTAVEHLLIIAGACSVLIIACVTIACLVSPYCWCHSHCPCAPKYPGGGKEKIRTAHRKTIHKAPAPQELQLFKPRSSSIDIQSASSQGSRIADLSPAKANLERSPLRSSTMNVQRYDRISVSRSEDSSDSSLTSLSSFIQPPHAVNFILKWDEQTSQIIIHLKTLLLPRPRRRRSAFIKVELLVDLLQQDEKRSFWPFGSKPRETESDLTGTVVREVISQNRRQNRELNFNEVLYLNYSDIKKIKEAILRFLDYTVQGGTKSDVAGSALLSLRNLTVGETYSLSLVLEPVRRKPKGEVFISLCYLPTAEKLTVIVKECRIFTLITGLRETTEMYINIALLFKNRAIGKKRSSSFFVKGETVTLNETHTFDLPRAHLREVCTLVTFKEVMSPLSDSDRGSAEETLDISDDEIGRVSKHDVTVGTTLIGQMIQVPEAQAHWAEMLAVSRTPVSHWHAIQ